MGAAHSEEGLQLLREGLLHPPARILSRVRHLFSPPTPAIAGGVAAQALARGSPCTAFSALKVKTSMTQYDEVNKKSFRVRNDAILN